MTKPATKTIAIKKVVATPKRKAAPKTVLPASVRAYAKAISADSKKSTDFLKRAGIILKAGELSPDYR